MTMRITMIETRMGEAASLLLAGQTYTVSDAFGAAMVGAKFAIDTDNALLPGVSTLEPARVLAVQALGVLAGASADWRAIQDSINTNGAVSLVSRQTYAMDEVILLGSGAVVDIGSGATISNTSAANRQHNMFRTGNADYVAADAIPGVTIICADEVSSYGEGTLTYNNAAKTLTWTAPGDTAGAPVNIGAVIAPASTSWFILPSGTAGRALYVIVNDNANRGFNFTKNVRLEPVTGARAMTWTRASNVLTVTEAGNIRQAGDVVALFGADVTGHVTIREVNNDGTWQAVQTGSDQAVAQSGRVYGTTRVTIRSANALLDMRSNVLAGQTTQTQNVCIALVFTSDPVLSGLNFARLQKFGIHCTGVSRFNVTRIRCTGEESPHNDILHISGPLRGGIAQDLAGTCGDNMIGIGTVIETPQTYALPSLGNVDIEDLTAIKLRPLNSRYEPVRLFCANAGWIRNVTIDDVAGTVDSLTTSVVSIITETASVFLDGGATNVDGLTVSNITCVRADRTPIPAFYSSGTGTRRNIRLDRIPLRAMTSETSGTVYVLGVLEDLDVTFTDGPVGFSGPGLSVSGTGRIKTCTVRTMGRVRADNQSPVTLGTGAATRPILVLWENTASVIDSLSIDGAEMEDVSSTGTKGTVVFTKGVTTGITLNNVFAINTDSVVRASSTATGTLNMRWSSVRSSGLNFDFVNDAAFTNPTINFSQCVLTANNAAFLNASTARTWRVFAANCSLGTRFIRNSANNNTYRVSAVSSTVATPWQSDAGTPVIQIGDSGWHMTIDGAVLDATVANHAAGSSFYNSNAAFGDGVGAYVRGSTTWTRVAA